MYMNYGKLNDRTQIFMFLINFKFDCNTYSYMLRVHYSWLAEQITIRQDA